MSNTPTHAITFMPAHPGWLVLTPIHGLQQKIDGVHKEPVIAWQVYSDTPKNRDPADPFVMVAPVTCEGTQQADETALQRPDGSITVPGISDYSSEADLIADWNEQAARRDARRAPAPQVKP